MTDCHHVGNGFTGKTGRAYSPGSSSPVAMRTICDLVDDMGGWKNQGMRMGIKAGMVLALLLFLCARFPATGLLSHGGADAKTLGDAKTLDQVLGQTRPATSFIDNDPPDPEALTPFIRDLPVEPFQSSGITDQPRPAFVLMVHLLRDRLMHAPPFHS